MNSLVLHSSFSPAAQQAAESDMKPVAHGGEETLRLRDVVGNAVAGCSVLPANKVASREDAAKKLEAASEHNSRTPNTVL